MTEPRNEGATLNFALFSTLQGFPDPRTAIAKVTAPVSSGRSAVSPAYWPAASPLRLFFGVPKGGVALSRDTRDRLGTQNFEAARFVRGPEATRLQLRAAY